MTRLVNLNMVSERLSAKARMGRRLGSGTSASAMAKRTLKTTICSTWPSATDLAMFSGKMSVMSCAAVWGETLSDCAAEVGVPGDAHHENAEEQRRDDDLDEPEKNGAEELQVYCDGGPVVAKLRAGEKADEDPGCQRAAGGGIGGDE